MYRPTYWMLFWLALKQAIKYGPDGRNLLNVDSENL